MMSRIVRNAVRLVILASALTLIACGGGPSQQAASPTAPSPTPNAASQARAAADQRISFLEARVARDPLDYLDLNSLTIERLQRARETGDVSELSRAADALARSLKINATDNYDAVALLASLSVTRHDFARASELARQAIAQKPNEAYGHGALGDALMGIGGYDEAAAEYAKDLSLDPGLSSYGRMALLDMNTGKRDDAARLWEQTLQSTVGDSVPEHAGWAHAQLANFDFLTGDLEHAQQEYQASLDAFPGYVHAYAGLGRVAAARSDYPTAIQEYTRAINVVPLPEYVIALGDVYAASGDQKQASAQYDLVGAIEQLYNANGVNLDIQIGLFNADHDRNVASTVDRAKAAYAQQPSIQAADMLAWVEYKAGDVAAARDAIKLALRTGTFDPLVLFHAGTIDKAAGDAQTAASELARVEQQAPLFSVRYASEAKTTLAQLESPSP